MLRAIVVAGGVGSRMLPYTKLTPKHLLPVGDAPLVSHQLHRLHAAGVTEVVLATGHFGDQLAAFVGDGSRWGLRVRHSRESRPLGTGGAVAAAYSLMDRSKDEAVVVINGDLLSDHDLRRHVAAANGSDLCLHVREVPDPRAFGTVITRHEAGVERVTRFAEKVSGPPGTSVNAGTYVFSAAALKAMPARVPLSLEREVFPQLVDDGGRVSVYREAAYFRDVGRPTDWVAASADAVLGRVRGILGHGQAWVHLDAVVGERATLCGGTAVHADAEVGTEAILDGCLVLGRGRVEAGARHHDEVIGPVPMAYGVSL